jgi:hypothetical protein
MKGSEEAPEVRRGLSALGRGYSDSTLLGATYGFIDAGYYEGHSIADDLPPPFRRLPQTVEEK